MPRLNHLALFQFKPECTAEDIDLVRRTFADLPKAIPGIIAFNWFQATTWRWTSTRRGICIMIVLTW